MRTAGLPDISNDVEENIRRNESQVQVNTLMKEFDWLGEYVLGEGNPETV